MNKDKVNITNNGGNIVVFFNDKKVLMYTEEEWGLLQKVFSIVHGHRLREANKAITKIDEDGNKRKRL